MIKPFFLFAIVFLVIVANKISALEYKELAAPPDEMPQDASEIKPVLLQSGSAIVPVTVNSQTLEAELELMLEENHPVHVIPLVDNAQFDTTSVISPSGITKESTIGEGIASMSVDTTTGNTRFTQAKSGLWKIKLYKNPDSTSIQSMNDAEQEDFQTHVLVASESPYKLYTQIKKRNFIVGQNIALSAHFALEGRDEPLKGAVTQMTAQIIYPDKTQTVIEFQDESQDGYWLANFIVNQVGHYSIIIKAIGITPEGDNFVRTSEHYFPVIERALELTGKARLKKAYQTKTHNNRIPIEIEAKVFKPIKRVQISAELWSDTKAINWFGGIVTVNEKNGSAMLTSSVDSRWLYKGQVLPTQLKNIELIDPDTHIVFSQLDSIGLTGVEEASALFDLDVAILSEGKTIDIDEEMLQGPTNSDEAESNETLSFALDSSASIMPLANIGDSNGRQVYRTPIFDGYILLVHGYCSKGDFWPKGFFTNAYTFRDVDANRTTDEFARLIAHHTKNLIPHYGVIAHSQGGMAALHMYVYYKSPLDVAAKRMQYLKEKYNMPEVRLIQTIGTPFLGTPLAGWIASIVRIFGVQCGSNYDLTPDGASAWLAKIPAWAKRQVYYHTTSYPSCSNATSFMLSRPNDGVVEAKRSILNGANSAGHTFDHCHTLNMNKPAQYYIDELNLLMNSKAAR